MDKRSGRNEHPDLSGEESGKGEKTIDGMVGRKPTSRLDSGNRDATERDFSAGASS